MKIDQWLNGWDEDPDFDSPLFDLMWNELIENQKIEKVIRAFMNFSRFKILTRKKDSPIK